MVHQEVELNKKDDGYYYSQLAVPRCGLSQLRLNHHYNNFSDEPREFTAYVVNVSSLYIKADLHEVPVKIVFGGGESVSMTDLGTVDMEASNSFVTPKDAPVKEGMHFQSYKMCYVDANGVEKQMPGVLLDKYASQSITKQMADGQLPKLASDATVSVKEIRLKPTFGEYENQADLGKMVIKLDGAVDESYTRTVWGIPKSYVALNDQEPWLVEDMKMIRKNGKTDFVAESDYKLLSPQVDPVTNAKYSYQLPRKGVGDQYRIFVKTKDGKLRSDNFSMVTIG